MQTYANHRVIPVVTLLAGAVVLAEVISQLRFAVVVDPGWGPVWSAVFAAAVLVIWWNSRRKAQIVQDRVIRLEMQLRLQRILEPRLALKAAQLTVRQLVALRFASDQELPALVERVLAGEFPTATAIKCAVTEWQEDVLRV